MLRSINKEVNMLEQRLDFRVINKVKIASRL